MTRQDDTQGPPGIPLLPSPASLDARHLLDVARLVGASALAALAQLAVDAPGSYFGAASETTRFGWAFVAGQALLTLFAIVATLRRHPNGRRATLLVLALNIAFFAIPFSSDPIVAGALVTWQAMVLISTARDAVALPRSAKEKQNAWLMRFGPTLRHLLVVSLLTRLAMIGWHLERHPLANFVGLSLTGATLWLSAFFLRALWRSGSRWSLLPVALLTVASIALYDHPVLALVPLTILEILLLLMVLVRTPAHVEMMARFAERPSLLIVGTFALLIAFGTVLLSFPTATTGDEPLAPIDALFTATSAACVTGLIVVDTGHDLEPLGQGVVLLLIQIGGLGIPVLSAFAVLLLGSGMGIRSQRALGATLDLELGNSVLRMVRFIVVATLACEAAGAAILAFAFSESGMAFPGALWHGVFHAVSAFCNAGFALWADSLVGFNGQPVVLLTVAVLITLGGIGFPVLAIGWPWRRGQRPPLTSHARMALVASAILVVSGMAVYALSEWRHSLAGLDAGDKLLNALFQSVTLRTAGFNSVDLGLLASTTLPMMLVFMFIGASPGGTGGGIKTTTAMVLTSAVPAVMRGHARVALFKRTVPLTTIYRSASITMITAGVGFLALTLLLACEAQPFDHLLFEVVSALATVGLSLGATAQLSVPGKLIITATMLVGRVGPLTLALLFGRQQAGKLSYPEARILVG